MAESNLEKFVERLKKDGIEAGTAEAEKIEAAAKAKADEIIKAANAEAEKIKAAAEADAKKRKEQSDAELKLAIRDALLELRSAISKTVSSVLKTECDNRLKDPSFLGGLISSTVSQYVQADLAGKSPKITLPDAMLPALSTALSNVATLSGGLKNAGFELVSSNGTLEVSAESVSTLLSELVNADLQKLMMDKA